MGKIAWHHDGVKIPALMNVDTTVTTTFITGTALRLRGNDDINRLYHWSAWVTAQGWEVEVIEDTTNRRELFCGNTFNLLLEVAAAIRRAL
jgi:hypothetical protein